MSHIYCQECGFQNPEAANYCARCGALLVRDEGGAETTQTFTPEEGDDSPSEALEDLGIKGPALVVRSGGGRTGEIFPLDGETTVGRSPDCGIFLDDVTVSRKHASCASATAASSSRTRAASTAPSSTASASSRRSSTTATSCRSASTGSPTSHADGDGVETPAAHDRHRLRDAQGRVPGHLDLQDPLPRGPGAARAAAHAGRLPAVQRGGRRAAGDDPAPAAGRVPAAARDPAGARVAGRRASASAAARSTPTRASSISTSSASARASTPGSRASSRTSGCSTPRTDGGQKRYSELEADIALACGRLAQYGIAPRHLRSFRTAADREAGLIEQVVGPALRCAEPGAPARRDGRPRGARLAGRGAVAAPLLARVAPACVNIIG